MCIIKLGKYTVVNEGHICDYRIKEWQIRTGRRRESCLLCWIGIGGMSMNSRVGVQMSVCGCSSHLCATHHHTLNSLQQQIFVISSFVCWMSGQVSGVSALESCLGCSQCWQELFSSGDSMGKNKNLLLSSPAYRQNMFPCSWGTESFRCSLSVTGSPSAPRGCPHFPAMRLSIGQFAT